MFLQIRSGLGGVMQSVTPVAGSGRLGSIPAFGLMPGRHGRPVPPRYRT